MRQFNTNPIIIKVVVLTMLATLALCVLVEYGTTDYQARAEEHQALLDEARHFKVHPLVLHGCTTDLECEKLDEMLEVINASYE